MRSITMSRVSVQAKDKSAGKVRGGAFRAVAKARRGPAAWFGYVVLRLLFMFMALFPLRWNLRSARMLARLWPVVLPRHRRRAVEHLRLAYGDSLSDARVEFLADRSLENMLMFVVEAICLPRVLKPMTWDSRISLRDFDEALRVIVGGRGAILVTGHYGAFELPAHMLASLGFDVAAIMRPLDNAYLNRFMVESRRTHGLELLDKKGASARAQEMVEDGYLLAFVGDQDAGRKGVFVDFFGEKASTYKSIGLLAMVTERPIIVGYGRRLGNTDRYEVGIERVIYPEEWKDRDDPLAWITAAYTGAIESFVREDPSQYLWIHRRWKSRPRQRRVRA